MASAIALQSTTGQTATISFNGTANKTVDANTLDQLIGVGQTWQDVTASRALGTTYTNTSGKPIMVSILDNHSTNSYISFYINGVQVAFFPGYGSNGGGTIIVPNGSTYSGGTENTLHKWFELR